MADITGYGNMRISYGGVDIDIATREYKIEKYNQESLKFEFDNQNNVQYLYKKGNRWNREIRVYQINQTDDEFKALFIALDKMNGKPVTLTPHLDEAGKTQLTWLTAFWDRYNEYPVEFIEIKLMAVDVE
jgi:hypothetical protein